MTEPTPNPAEALASQDAVIVDLESRMVEVADLADQVKNEAAAEEPMSPMRICVMMGRIIKIAHEASDE